MHFPEIDLIAVYDLGLSALERAILAKVENVQIRQVPPFCPHYLDADNFAWKTAAVCEALEYGEAVLWLDAGIELQGPIDDLFETIETDGYLFNITPLNQPNCKIGNLSHARSLSLLDADSDFVRNSYMVNGGVMGYLRGHPASGIARAAMEYAADPEIIVGPRETHRHDQTIYSVLRVKNGLPAQYYMFDLERINPRYRFLIRATEPVPATVLSNRASGDLHIYLLVTRDQRPYALARSINFGRSVLPAWLLLLVRIMIGKPMTFLTKRIRRLKASVSRKTPVSNEQAPVEGK